MYSNYDSNQTTSLNPGLNQTAQHGSPINRRATNFDNIFFHMLW